MNRQDRVRGRRRSRRIEKSLDEPEKLSPIPAATPPEEPQVDEVLPSEERREYRRAQRERRHTPL